MCDCGCDSLPWARSGIVEPAVVPKKGIMFPNRRDIPASSTKPEVIDIKHPVILESINALAGGSVFAWPRETGAAAFTQGEFYTGSAGGGDNRVRLTIPFPGVWNVASDAVGAGPYRILDACGCAGALYGGVRVIGGAVTPAAAPLTMSAPTFATVGVASALAVAANTGRRFISLQNTHATGVIYLGFGAAAAVVGSGIAITPGNFKSFNQPGEDLSREAINAISTVAATNMAIQEGI